MAAHPDDETIRCACAIATLREQPWVIFVTTGSTARFDLMRGAEPYKQLWGTRQSFNYTLTMRFQSQVEELRA